MQDLFAKQVRVQIFQGLFIFNKKITLSGLFCEKHLKKLHKLNELFFKLISRKQMFKDTLQNCLQINPCIKVQQHVRDIARKNTYASIHAPVMTNLI